MKKVQSTCNYCALDCNMDFYVEDGRIVKVLPTKGYPVNDGFCCIKGLSLDRQQTVVKTSPLPKIRQADGSMKEVTWDEGFSHVADKLKELQEKYGKESVAGNQHGSAYHGGICTVRPCDEELSGDQCGRQYPAVHGNRSGCA